MKNNRWIYYVVILLVIALAVFAWLNRGNIAQKRDLEESARFNLISGETKTTVNMNDLLELGSEEFTTVMDTSTTDPTEVTMRGVELRKIFEQKGIVMKESQSVEVRALDGYASALTYDELMTTQDVYIVFEMNGEALGVKAEGGMGPYLMVIRSSQYAQRWVKFVQDVEIR